MKILELKITILEKNSLEGVSSQVEAIMKKPANSI